LNRLRALKTALILTAENKPSVLFENETLNLLSDDISQPFNDKDSAYTSAWKSKNTFNKILSTLADSLSARWYFVNSKKSMKEMVDDLKKPGIMMIYVPVKEEKRAKEKVEKDYGGSWSRIGDLLRASIVVDNFDELKQVIQLIFAAGLHLARKPKDRFANPVNKGYRDVLLNVILPNGHVAEIQLHLKPMFKAKEETYKFYKKIRENKNQRQIDINQEKMKSLYDEAWQKIGEPAVLGR
jgi:hypothetical protein